MVSKLVTYLREAQEELKKVVWPTRKQTIQYTILVVVVSVAIATFMGGADALLNLFIETFLV